MKRRNVLRYFAAAAASLAVLIYMILIHPALYERQCRTRVYPDMTERIDEIRLSVIGIMPRYAKEDGTLTYGGGGTGVIFEKKENTYYALTAAHVINDPQAEYKVFTQKTTYETVNDTVLEEMGIEIAADSFYDSLAHMKTEYISPDSDIAIIRFESEEDLPIAAFEESSPDKGKRIVCLGHPDGRKLTVTYGSLKSVLKAVTMKDIHTGQKSEDLVIEHNAWLNAGSSGGPVLSENMKLYGISTGGSFTLTGRFRKGFMIPSDQIKECIRLWKQE